MKTKKLLVIAILFLIVIAAVMLVNVNDAGFGSTIFSITTFLFGIYASFTISDRHHRIDQIREMDSQERSSMQSIYDFSKIFGNGFQKKISNAIENYLIDTFDYKIWDFKNTGKSFSKISELILSVKPKKSVVQSETFRRLLENLDQMGNAREQTIALIDDRLSKLDWIIFVVLSGIIVTSTALINYGSVFSAIVLILLDFVIILVLIFMWNLDDLSWRNEVRIFEPYQRAFESIGKMRYYPEQMIMNKDVKLHRDKTYRMASYPKPYPDFTGKKIKIIKAPAKPRK